MDDLNLKCQTDSRIAILDAIATQTAAKQPQTKEVKEIVFSKEKKEIKKGITFQDIFQHYNLDEIQLWAKENGLKVSGTKKVLIDRILAYLEGEKENILAGSRLKPKKKALSEEAKKKKLAQKKKEKEGTKTDPKKSVTKTTVKKTSITKPEESEESEEDVEPTITDATSEEEIVNEKNVEPDFENMSIEELRTWCKGHEINSKGTKKEILQRIGSLKK